MDLFATITKRRNLVLMAFSLLGILLLVWIYSTSFIKIQVTNNSSEAITYELLNQDNGKLTTFETKETALTKRVPRGNYEVLVTQGGSSHWSMVKTKSFMRPTTVEAPLTKEREREFVGTNPDSCAYYDRLLAFSYACNGTLAELTFHTPATDQTPPSGQAVTSDSPDLDVGGIVKIDGKRYIYAQGVTDLESDAEEPLIYELVDSGQLGQRVNLDDVNGDQPHKITPYRDGFLLYSADAGELKYYRTPTSKPEKITVARPDKKNAQATGVSTYGELVAITYVDAKQAEKADAHDENQTGKTYVQVYDQKNTKGLEINRAASSVLLCGKATLCLISNNSLYFYDISGKKAKELYHIKDTKNVVLIGKQIAVERSTDVLRVDIERRTGAVSYSFDKYTSCGLNATTSEGYLMCVINNKNNQNLLFIDNTKENASNIDKKVYSLLEQPYVEAVSAYKNFVFVSPNVGSLVYNPATKGYEPDPILRSQVAKQLTDFVNSSSLNGYQIINTRL